MSLKRIRTKKQKSAMLKNKLIIFFILSFAIFFISNQKNKVGIDYLKIFDLHKTKGIVCIDPGHGGPVKTTAPNQQEMEKRDVLRLALLVKKKLEKEGIKVIMTRETDKEVSLEDRCKIANEAKCDLFVSIHRNISEIPGVGKGIEVWLSCNKDKVAEILGNNIHEELKDTPIQRTRGIKYGSMGDPGFDYYVNSHTNMPSCLLEMGFMTDSKDNYLFNKYIDKYADAITKGIVKTLEEK